MLWGRAAARCEFAGCNRPLWKSTVTQEPLNTAQQAHIYSVSSDGPRGNAGVFPTELSSLANLMLLCHQCHRKIDAETDGGHYTAALLRDMKLQHEARVALVTGIAATKDSDRYKLANFIGVAVCNSIPHETRRGPARLRPSPPWSP